MKDFYPELIDSFKELLKTNHIELLGETYYHSLSSLFSDNGTEFKDQVSMHKKELKKTFNYTPTVFRNTECIFNNSISQYVKDLGYKGICTEGADQILSGWRSPNYLYKNVINDIPIFLRNFHLCDELISRLNHSNWEEWGLLSKEFAQWLSRSDGDAITLILPYHILGERHGQEKVIFSFFNDFPQHIHEQGSLQTSLPSKIIGSLAPVGDIDVFELGETISWTDSEKDISPWISNQTQWLSFEELKHLSTMVKKTENKTFLHLWRLMQTSDHFYYMSTKDGCSQDARKQFSPFNTPMDAFVTYTKILTDLENRIIHSFHEK